MKITIPLVIILALLNLSYQAPSRELVEGSKYDNEDYLKVFRVPNTFIESYSSNGGGRDSNPLDYAFDDNWNNYWMSGKNNDNTFKTEVTVKFKQTLSLERMMYQCQNYYTQGYPRTLVLKYKLKSETDYKQITIESPDDTNQLVMFYFGQAITCDEIVVRWELITKNLLTNVATARELTFFQPETNLLFKSLSMFTYNYQSLEDEFYDEQKINQIEQEAKSNVNYETAIKERILRAKGVLAGAFQFDTRREFTTNKNTYYGNILYQHGDVKGYVLNTLKASWAGTNKQVTGIYARSGDIVTFYVDANDNDKLPQVIYSQFKGHWSCWHSGGPVLKKGRNVLTFPNFNTASFANKVAPGGPIYLANPYLPSEQSQNVRVYIEGGTLFPVFRKGDDQLQYNAFRDEYLHYYEGKEDDGYFDMTELVGDRTIHTIDASRTVEPYKTYDANKSINDWDEFLKSLLKFIGVKYDPSEEYYSPIAEWVNINYRYSQPYGAAYGINEHVGIFGDGWLNQAVVASGFGWGFAHEVGHMIDNNQRCYSECTTNMPSKYHEDAVQRQSSRGDFAATVLWLTPDGIEPLKRCGDHQFWKHVGINFLFYWHIESLFHGYWGRLDNIFRYQRFSDDGTMTNPERQALYGSLATGIDLSEYFERWGYDFTGSDPAFTISGASETYKKYIEQLKSEGKIDGSKRYKLWYLDRLEYNYIADNGFVGCPSYTESTTIEIDKIIKGNGNSYALVLPTPSCKGHLGYEIYVNDVVKNFTYETTFVVENVDASATFSIAAYDRLLNHTKKSTAKRYQAPAAVCKIGNTNYVDLQSAFNAVSNGQTIELLTDIYVGGTVTFDKSISITIANSQSKDISINRMFNGHLIEIVNGNVKIQGRQNAKIIFDGSHSATGRFITVKNAAQLTAQYITLQNTNTNEDGAAIYLESTAQLTLSDSTVTNCNGNSGVHYSSASNRGSVTNVLFQRNQGKVGSGLRSRATVDVINCQFIENSGTTGGAVSNESGGVMKITGTTFKNNKATNGGAFYADGFTTFTDCILTENEAQNGAAIYENAGNGSRTIELLGTTKVFKNNATNRGGAIFINKGKAILTSVEVYDNFIESSNTESFEHVYINSGCSLYLTSGCKINGGIYKEDSGIIVAKGSMPSPYNNQIVTITFPFPLTTNVMQKEQYTFMEEDLSKVRIVIGSLAIDANGALNINLNNFVGYIVTKKGDEIIANETLEDLTYGQVLNISEYARVDDPTYYLDSIKNENGAVLKEPITVNRNMKLTLEFKEYIPITFDYLGTQYVKYVKPQEVLYLPYYRLDEQFDKEKDCTLLYYMDDYWDFWQPYEPLIAFGPKTLTAVFDNCYEIKFMRGSEVLKVKRVGFGTALTLPRTIGDKTINTWKDQNGVKYNAEQVIDVMEHMTFVAEDLKVGSGNGSTPTDRPLVGVFSLDDTKGSTGNWHVFIFKPDGSYSFATCTGHDATYQKAQGSYVYGTTSRTTGYYSVPGYADCEERLIKFTVTSGCMKRALDPQMVGWEDWNGDKGFYLTYTREKILSKSIFKRDTDLERRYNDWH